MGAQVFISYSSKDKPVGDAACAVLEQRGFRCWIAPRDIVPGTEWGEAIIGGLTVKLGSRMVDSSLRSKLNAIKHAMKEAG